VCRWGFEGVSSSSSSSSFLLLLFTILVTLDSEYFTAKLPSTVFSGQWTILQQWIVSMCWSARHS
jgi:hypothetical protein